ncbi:MAG: hypothetical protein GDA41_00830 [Rhodospirillales bacterium]|nr:hypothetical protein [Rhodospirillales bacterium]
MAKAEKKQEVYDREQLSKRFVWLGKMYRQMHTEGEKIFCIKPEEMYTNIMTILQMNRIHAGLTEIFDFARSFVLLMDACHPACKHLPKGESAHIALRKPNRWRRKSVAVAAGRSESIYV